MSDHYDHLAPERVDEYIQQYPKSLNSADAYLINDLQQYYQNETQKHNQSLNNVWKRIHESQEYSKHAKNAVKTHPQLPITQQENKEKNRIITMQQKTRPQGSLRSQKTGLFITTACALALVASMLVVFNVLQVNSNKNKSHVASNTTRVIPTPPPLKTNVPDPGAYITVIGPNNSMPLEKVDLKTHKLIWTHNLGNNSTTNPLAVGSVIYIASMTPPGHNLDQLVTAIDSKTGKTLWETEMDSDTQILRTPITPQMRDLYKSMEKPFPANQKYIEQTIDYNALATPTFANGVLYLENEGGRITALNANTGKKLWVHEVGDGANAEGTRYGANQLVVVNNVVYGSIHKTLFALNAQTGKSIWSNGIDAAQIFTQPTLVNNTIYLASAHSSGHSTISHTAYAYAYNAQNGQRIWQQELGSQFNVGNVALHHNMLYIGAQKILADGSASFTFLALDASSGAIKWQNHIGSPFVTPLFENNVLYLQESATYTPEILHAYDAATGNELWSKNMDGISPFELHNGVIYGVGPGHDLSALSTKDGSVIWQGSYAPKALDKLKEDSGRVYTGTIEPEQ